MAQSGGPQFTDMLGALSQPARVRIVQIAAAGGPDGTAAGDIARMLRCPPSTLSFHLKELSRCGLLRATQQGRYLRYAVRPEAYAALAEFVGSLPSSAGSKSAKGRAKRRRPGRAKRAAAGVGGQLSIFGD